MKYVAARVFVFFLRSRPILHSLFTYVHDSVIDTLYQHDALQRYKVIDNVWTAIYIAATSRSTMVILVSSTSKKIHSYPYIFFLEASNMASCAAARSISSSGVSFLFFFRFFCGNSSKAEA